MSAPKRIAKAQGTTHQSTRARREPAMECAYRTTTYAADIEGVTHAIRVGRLHEKVDAQLRAMRATTWACITAWNPQSQLLSAAENRRRHARLEQALHERQVRWYHMRATGDAGDWPTEEGVMAIGISRVSAKSLGKKFDQVAIVWGRLGEEAELVWM